MNNTITGREELLLAKIAGEDVNLSTMTLPVAMNKREALLLDIADRIDELDGGGQNEATDSGIVELEAEFGQNENDQIVATCNNITAAEAYTAISSGKFVKMTIQMDSVVNEAIIPILANKATAGAETTYTFMFINESGARFVADGLAGTDVLVFVSRESF